jgi:hypothetical protein
MLISRFDYKKLVRENINGTRLYSCPSGSKLPSVTTILSKTVTQEKKQILENWKNRVGRDKAAAITHEAASRGTKIHSFLEKYIQTENVGDSGTNPFSIESHKMAKHIIANGLKNVKEFYASEAFLYYDPLYAGATDTVFLENGEIVLGDFKQSNRIKLDSWVEDYKNQIAAYIVAHNNMFGTDIKKGKIMMCTPKLEYQQWILEGDELEKHKEIWWNKLDQYYTKKFGV